MLHRSALLGMVVGLAWTATALGGTTGNIIGGGDFEQLTKITFDPGAGGGGTVQDYAHYKQQHSPRTAEEISAGANPVRAWQFHPQFDLGRWMTVWGVGPSGDYDNQIGITTQPDPRSLYQNNAWVDSVNNQNISVDPFNAGNHVMEGVTFRSWMGQFVEAPNRQTTGTAQIDFDYYIKYWNPDPDAPVILHAYVYGLPEAGLPTWQQRWGPGSHDIGTTPNLTGWDLLYSSPHWSNWGGNLADNGFVQIAYGSPFTPQWRTLSDGVTSTVMGSDPAEYLYTDGSFNLGQTYAYYYVEFWLCVYSEPHPYFWLYGGRPADEFSVAVDNVSLEMARIPFLPGDMNLDDVVNVQDINPFVQVLGSEAAYKAYLATRLATLGLDPSLVDQVFDEVDPNQSGVINVQDINPFVALLAGSGVDAAQLAVIPEPASLSLLVLAGLTRLARSSRPSA
ncbi:MAG: hypothetical protein IT441_00475 [Phycisphaeraceae bacterium]|nr:hypothetical protein [Phycisphaeraceae bacterium]